jgi:hypothetical protein
MTTSVQTIARSEICAKARGWVNTPFRHLGRDRKGVDCAGLVLGVAQDLGLTETYGLPKLTYGKIPNPKYMVAEMAQWMKATGRKFDELIPGDVATFWAIDRGAPRHLIIIGWDALCQRRTMIHSFSKFSKVVEHSFDRFWPDRFIAAYEYPDTSPDWVR